MSFSSLVFKQNEKDLVVLYLWVGNALYAHKPPSQKDSTVARGRGVSTLVEGFQLHP